MCQVRALKGHIREQQKNGDTTSLCTSHRWAHSKLRGPGPYSTLCPPPLTCPQWSPAARGHRHEVWAYLRWLTHTAGSLTSDVLNTWSWIVAVVHLLPNSWGIRVPYIAFRSFLNRLGTLLFRIFCWQPDVNRSLDSPVQESSLYVQHHQPLPVLLPVDAQREASSLVAGKGGVPAKRSSLCSPLANSWAHKRLRFSSQPVPINLACGSVWNSCSGTCSYTPISAFFCTILGSNANPVL